MSLFPQDIILQATGVLEACRERGLCIAVAESCTAGLLSAALTEVSGASEVFDRGFVTYSNEAKVELLDVSLDVIDTFGSVSVAVAWAMAQGALRHSRADIAVGVTGVAGPGGGTERKPVGTVVFALARRDGDPDDVHADMRQFGDLGRTEIRLQAVRVALELLMPAPAVAPGP